MFPNANELQKKQNLGRLKTTKTLGDTDGDGDHDIIYAYGGRSFSIWKEDGTLVFDSGNAFENIISKRSPDMFNANGPSKIDDRSDDKGPEPEALAIGKIDGRTYAFIGMERNNAIFAYDITLPSDPHMVSYIMPNENHNSPEGLEFISSSDSPTGKPLLAIAFEMTGTIGLYEINNQIINFQAIFMSGIKLIPDILIYKKNLWPYLIILLKTLKPISFYLIVKIVFW